LQDALSVCHDPIIQMPFATLNLLASNGFINVTRRAMYKLSTPA